MYHHIEIRTSFRFIFFSTFIINLPSLFLEIKCIHVGHVVRLFWYVTTVNDHFLLEYYCWMRVDLWDCDIGTDFLPFLSLYAIGKDQIARKDRWNLTPKEVDSVFVDDWGMRLQLDRLSIAFIIELDPNVLFGLLWNIHAMKVGKHTFISIEASMDKETILVYSRGMIRSWSNIFSLYFDLGPSWIECIL